MKILVTGGTGMLGHALRERLTAVYVGSKQADLRYWGDTAKLFRDTQPECVIHCAARVGGIKDNSEKHCDYFTENVQINTNVVDACVRHKVPKLIAISSTCVYPANPPSFPITEDMLHLGPPEQTNFGYAYAKRMMQAHIDAARMQFGHKWSVIYPSNLYGPHDTFDLQRSHVVPALMLKMHKAKTRWEESVTLFGSGKALRQLTYVDDLARFIERLSESAIFGDFNFASPLNYEIAAIAEMVKEVVGYKGKIEFAGGLDGVARKDVSVVRAMLDCPFEVGPFMSLYDGLTKTYDWFLNNTEQRT